jgi:hypothetical protein
MSVIAQAQVGTSRCDVPESLRGSAACLPRAANGIRLAIAVLAAIARPAIIHRAIFAGLLANRLIGRERAGANDCG